MLVEEELIWAEASTSAMNQNFEYSMTDNGYHKT